MKRLNATILIALAVTVCSAITVSAQFSSTIITMTGAVFNELNRQPAGVNLTFFDEDGKRVNSSRSNVKDGYYLVTGLKPGETYKVKIEHPEFFQTEYTVMLPKTDKYAEISRDFLVKPLRNGVRLPLAVSPFEYKKSKLRVGAEEYLGEIKQLLVMNPGVGVDIASYPDSDENKEENMRLSRERCEMIRSYLQKQGIAPERVRIKPSENTDPINPPPLRKGPKGKRYIGSTYVVVVKT